MHERLAFTLMTHFFNLQAQGIIKQLIWNKRMVVGVIVTWWARQFTEGSVRLCRKVAPRSPKRSGGLLSSALCLYRVDPRRSIGDRVGGARLEEPLGCRMGWSGWWCYACSWKVVRMMRMECAKRCGGIDKQAVRSVISQRQAERGDDINGCVGADLPRACF